jgi:hypothetical protein
MLQFKTAQLTLGMLHAGFSGFARFIARKKVNVY